MASSIVHIQQSLSPIQTLALAFFFLVLIYIVFVYRPGFSAKCPNVTATNFPIVSQ
jgi:hypothetical protein